MTPPKHAPNCDWHLDQYNHECTCNAAIRDTFDQLEKLASPDAAHLPEEYIAGRMIALINQRGFLEKLRAAFPNWYTTT